MKSKAQGILFVFPSIFLKYDVKRSNCVAVTTVAGQLGHANTSEVMEDLLNHSTITTINQKVKIG